MKEIDIIIKDIKVVANISNILFMLVISKFSKIISSGSGAKATSSLFSFSKLFIYCFFFSLLNKQIQK